MKLWTVQEKKLLNSQAAVISCGKETEEISWRISYVFMAKFYEKIKGKTLESPFIWAWYDGDYFTGKVPQLDIVSTVESSAEYLRSKCVINLNVPDSVPLLSSYSKWNRLMEYVATFNKTPSCLEDWEGMFDLTGMADHEYTQAVLPHIHRSWIVGVEELKLDYFR